LQAVSYNWCGQVTWWKIIKDFKKAFRLFKIAFALLLSLPDCIGHSPSAILIIDAMKPSRILVLLSLLAACAKDITVLNKGLAGNLTRPI
jgi:hypothetical protein